MAFTPCSFVTRQRRFLPTALALGLASPLLGQDRAPLVLTLPASTEALSLGTVFPVSSGDPDAVFYNAGALAGADGISAAVQRFGSQTTLVTASGALPWWHGAVGVGLQALNYGASEDATPTLDDLLSDGEVGASEMVVSLAYARTFGDDVRIGAVGKLVEQRIGATRDAAVALDVGGTADIGFLTLGAAVQNIGSNLALVGAEAGLPDRITLSASFEPEPVGPFDVRAVGALSRRFDGEVIPAGGLDLRYWPVQGRTFIARAGLVRVPQGPAEPITLGFAFRGDQLSLEYAFQPYEGTRDAHRLGVRWRR